MSINNSNTKTKKEPEDILAEVDKPVSRRMSQKKVAQNVAEEKTAAAASAASHRFPFIFGGIATMVILAGIAGFLMLSQEPETNNNIAKSNLNANINPGKTNENGNTNNAPVANANSAPSNGNASQKITNDTDGDGLTNEDEAKAGTDSKNPDTDGDNLSDREEVKVWKTNPLKADTDGDGYNDGQEIKTLNDPKVPGGKLLDLNRAIQGLNVNK